MDKFNNKKMGNSFHYSCGWQRNSTNTQRNWHCFLFELMKITLKDHFILIFIALYNNIYQNYRHLWVQNFRNF